MNCHSQIFADSPYLEPVRASWRENKPIEWVKVHDLPDFVYFDHHAHVNKGLGCSTCHGDVTKMALVYQVAPLKMEWCLKCHFASERNLRPRDQIYNPSWKPGQNQLEEGRRLKERYQVLD
ncbi:MAG TPA: cytochrome c3 family protein [Blastocatellia bacterium]|nr:cytochrome c3 family protein [Blastocatellia bacterium]